MSIDFSQASKDERDRFAQLLEKHDAQNCKSCGAPIVIEGCNASEGNTECGTEFSVISVACSACGADVVTASSWTCGYANVCEFLDDLEWEWEWDK